MDGLAVYGTHRADFRRGGHAARMAAVAIQEG